MQLMNYLEQWISAGGVIIIKDQLLPAQSNCPVQIKAFNETQCVMSTTCTVTSTRSFDYLIGVIAVIIVLALFVILLLLIFIGVLLNKLKKSKNNEIKDIK